MMNNEETNNHILTYSEVKEPQKQLIEKHGSPRKASVLNFNPDGSLCIPADLKEKLALEKPVKTNPSKPALPKSRSSTSHAADVSSDAALGKSKNEGSTSQENSSKENLTPDSTRKRRKNVGPRYPKGKLSSKKNIIVYVKPEEGCCHFCYTNDVSKELGEMRDIDGVLGHHSCLLFSSGLCQAGKNEEGLWGFLLPDIKKELSRGKRLKCSFCRQPGALVGCQKARCQYSYHFTCGLTHGCLMQYYDNFRSYCASHRPMQHYLAEMIGQSAECPVCGDVIQIKEKNVPRDILVTECCNMTPLHRACIQNQADASGYFFRCPMCNNEKKFNAVMKIMGINVPQSDAVWEKEGYFDELLEEYWNCDVPICLHENGRKGDSRNKDQWDLMKCVTCGQAGAHPACLGYDRRGPKDWNCSNCIQIEAKLEQEKQVEEKKAKEAAAKLPPSAQPGSSSAPAASTAPKLSASSNRSRQKTLSPSKDPFLMSTEVLKEAVFKLCVARLKQLKLIRKTLDPDNWIGIRPAEAAEEEPLPPLPLLNACKFSILLTKLKYTPPPTPLPTPLVEELEEEEEVVFVDEQKERLFELALKTHKAGLGTGKRGIKRSRQTSLNKFFKRTDMDSDETESRPKRRKKSEPSLHEPFPFTRSPHSITDAIEIQSNSVSPDTASKNSPARACPIEDLLELPVFGDPIEGTPKTPTLVSSLKTPTKSTVLVIKRSYSPPLDSSPPLALCPSPNVYKCYYCSDKFTKLSIRLEHMKSSHPGQMRGWSGSKGKSRAGTSSSDDCLGEPIKTEGSEERNEPCTASHRSSSRPRKPAAPHQGWNWISRGKKGRGRPTTSKDSAGTSDKEIVDLEEKKNVSVYEEEMMKYDELCIESCSKEEEKKEKEESASSFPSFPSNLFALSHPPKQSGKVSYDWTDGEIASMIEFYSLNSPLWDSSRQDETSKPAQDKLIRRLERKLGIPAEAITSKWKSLQARYKQEKHCPGSTWRYLSQLDFLQQNSLVSCPEDVSPLFSLLNRKSSGSPESSPEASKEDYKIDLDNSQDIFDMSDEDGNEEFFDNQDNSWEEDDSAETHDLETSRDLVTSRDLKTSCDLETSRDLVTSRDPVTSRDKSSKTYANDAADISWHTVSSEGSDSMTSPDLTTSSELVTSRENEYSNDATASGIVEELHPSKIGEHLCSQCSKMFPSRADLTRHRLQLRYFCVHCTRNYTSLAKLKQHQKSLEQETLQTCPFCSMEIVAKFGKLFNVMRHISEAHLDKWVAYECKFCVKTFERKEKAIEHVKRRHSRAPPGDCDNWVKIKDYRCLYD